MRKRKRWEIRTEIYEISIALMFPVELVISILVLLVTCYRKFFQWLLWDVLDKVFCERRMKMQNRQKIEGVLDRLLRPYWAREELYYSYNGKENSLTVDADLLRQFIEEHFKLVKEYKSCREELEGLYSLLYKGKGD